MPTSPTPVPAGPAVPDSSNTEATFDAQWEAFNAWVTNDLQPGVNALAVNVKSNADECALSATAAAAQALIATLQANAAASSAITAGAVAWVSGTTYAIGNARFSPINGQTYRRFTAGAGTTDPSADATNWVIVNGLVNQAVSIPVNNLPAIRPSLDLDFANSQTVDPRITFTRASTATRTNSKGLIELVPGGVPRIDFDPVTGACKGLLIEAQRTNLLTYSEDYLNPVWSKTRAAITANVTTAPDGALTADKLSNNGVIDSTGYLRANVTWLGSTAYAASFYLKAGEIGLASIEFVDSGGFVSNGQVSLNLLTGLMTGTGLATASATPLPNGWWRLSLPATPLVGAGEIRVTLPADATAGTDGLFLWGAQLEAGAFPTSYIPTVASQVTRAADVATMTGANFSSWYRQDEGSFVAEFSRLSNIAGGRVFVAHDGTPNEQLRVSPSVSVNIRPDFQIIDGGVVQANVIGTAEVAIGALAKCAAAYAINSISSAVNGALGAADVAATLPTLTTLGIGTSEVATTQLNGHIRSVSYYPKRLTNAELQALSTQ